MLVFKRGTCHEVMPNLATHKAAFEEQGVCRQKACNIGRLRQRTRSHAVRSTRDTSCKDSTCMRHSADMRHSAQDHTWLQEALTRASGHRQFWQQCVCLH
jgi:hypothetical protein